MSEQTVTQMHMAQSHYFGWNAQCELCGIGIERASEQFCKKPQDKLYSVFGHDLYPSIAGIEVDDRISRNGEPNGGSNHLTWQWGHNQVSAVGRDANVREYIILIHGDARGTCVTINRGEPGERVAVVPQEWGFARFPMSAYNRDVATGDAKVVAHSTWVALSQEFRLRPSGRLMERRDAALDKWVEMPDTPAFNKYMAELEGEE